MTKKELLTGIAIAACGGAVLWWALRSNVKVDQRGMVYSLAAVDKHFDKMQQGLEFDDLDLDNARDCIYDIWEASKGIISKYPGNPYIKDVEKALGF